jgi:hypothetical protein
VGVPATEIPPNRYTDTNAGIKQKKIRCLGRDLAFAQPDSRLLARSRLALLNVRDDSEMKNR